MEKMEFLNTFVATVFYSLGCPLGILDLEIGKRVGKRILPLIKEDLVRDHLGKLAAHKSMGPDEMHP